MTDVRTVRLSFIDHERRIEFARTDMPAGQMPASFTSGMSVTIGEDMWQVVSVDPSDVAAAVAVGHMTVSVRRVQMMDPTDVLFSLPTICDVLAQPGPATPAADLWEMHDDDWRQVEWVHRSRIDVVGAEIAQVQRILREHAHPDGRGLLTGYSEMHIRQHPVAPLAGVVALSDWLRLLPEPTRRFDGIRYHDAGVAAGSFASAFGPLVVYGVANDQTVQALGLHGVTDDPMVGRSLAGAMHTYDLVLVDWCRCTVIGADEVADYLDEA